MKKLSILLAEKETLTKERNELVDKISIVQINLKEEQTEELAEELWELENAYRDVKEEILDCNEAIKARRKVNKHVGIEDDEEFPAYAWPGGYTLIYLDDENSTLCAKCANDEEDSHLIVGADTYDEGPDLYCDGCNAVIESSYGDPDSEEEGEE